MHMAWVDPWSLTLVDKTPEKVMGLLDPLSSILMVHDLP
jgi:hypothetical protein